MSNPKSSQKTTVPTPALLPPSGDPFLLTKRHLRFGWWTLLIFLSLGLILEILHGFKVSFYLSVSNETRRLMWTLAHAHGTLLALVNLAFAFTVRLLPEWSASQRGVASLCLRGATILMPAGFFVGGMVIYSGDPGLGILLVPAGGILLFLSAMLAALGSGTFKSDRGKSGRN